MNTEVLERPPEVEEEELSLLDGNITLTSGQDEALHKLVAFLMDPVERVFVLSGYSGCGKSTLVRTFLTRLAGYLKVAHLLNPNMTDYEVQLSATTNKAAENLSQITGYPVGTIHSTLGLRVQTDFKANTSVLVPRPMELLENSLLFIDEYSQIDKELLGYVFSRTKNCKVVFIGDPAQLTGIKSTNVPVIEAGFSGAELTQVVRQAEGNPIVDLSTAFRNTVNTGIWTPFTPDGHHIQRLDRNDFNAAIEREFTRPNWKYADSKILGWTNKCVIGFNQYVRNLAKGDPHFQVDDYAVCNQYLQSGKQSLKTDQLVLITRIDEDCERHGVPGNFITVDHIITAFQPKSLVEKNLAIKQARAQNELHKVAEMEQQWIDLRGAYAQTINKSQGSTYGSVFIDLDDVGRCNSGDQVARMLYVGVSRAKNHVYLTGDLA